MAWFSWLCPALPLVNLCEKATHADEVGFSATVYLYRSRFLTLSERPAPTSMEHFSLRPRWNTSPSTIVWPCDGGALLRGRLKRARRSSLKNNGVIPRAPPPRSGPLFKETDGLKQGNGAGHRLVLLASCPAQPLNERSGQSGCVPPLRPPTESVLAHHAERWTRFPAQDNALVQRREHRMDPKRASPLLGPML
jgi:hypothetical protein